MREWQMTDDQFRAQSYKNMQIQKRKRKSEKRARTEDVPLVKNERKVEFGYFFFKRTEEQGTITNSTSKSRRLSDD